MIKYFIVFPKKENEANYLLRFREAICIFLLLNVDRRGDISVSPFFLQVGLEQQFPCFVPVFVRLLVWRFRKNKFDEYTGYSG